jgi:hypothetical protein
MDAHKMDSPGPSVARAGNAGIVVEKARPGQPHKGRVFVAVHAHLPDLPYYAGGLCAKLILEGYTGYLVRTTNDEKYGGRTIAQNILSNEQEHLKMAAALGFKDVIDLYYRAHRMNEISPTEIRGPAHPRSRARWSGSCRRKVLRRHLRRDAA